MSVLDHDMSVSNFLNSEVLSFSEIFVMGISTLQDRSTSNVSVFSGWEYF